MELTVAGIVLLAASIHPFRDLILKGTVFPEAAYLGVILVWAVIAVIHAFVLDVDLASGLPVLPLILISTVGLMFYYIGILTTLKTGDLSVYYPIIRAAPLFIVVFGWLILGQRYGPVMLAGVALVMAGAFFLQYRKGSKLLQHPATFLTATLAMAGMGTQSLADSEAMKTIEPAVLLVWGYFLLAPACGIYFIIRKPAGRSPLEHLFGGWRKTPLRYLGAAVTSYLSYYLILVSYQLGGNVAAVNSLRQASIPLSVILGGYFLKEADTKSRLAWAFVLAGGIVVIILAR
ncbi:MAG: DMT family transporter [Rhodospirillales bacterium]